MFTIYMYNVQEELSSSSYNVHEELSSSSYKKNYPLLRLKRHELGGL